VQIAEHQIAVRMHVLPEHNADGGNAGKSPPRPPPHHHLHAPAKIHPHAQKPQKKQQIASVILNKKHKQHDIKKTHHQPQQPPH
ncbi:hypothetical protein ACVGWU_00595, partial [Enterobacter intestinihominis]